MFSVNTKNAQFTQVFNDYYALIISTINQKVDDIDAAEDIAQAVFIKFYEKFETVVDSRKWLYIAMKYEIYNWLRRQKQDVNIDEVFTDVALTYVNGFRDTRIILDGALNSISEERDRIMIDLIAVQRYTYRQTGHELGMTVRQVKYRYNILVRQVLLYLKDKGIGSLEELL